MNEKILNVFDILAGYYEYFTGRSANDDGKFAISLGCPPIFIGGVLEIISKHYMSGTISFIVGVIITSRAVMITKTFTPRIMRASLEVDAVFLLILMFMQSWSLCIPGHGLSDFGINLLSIGFIIYGIGQLFFASNPKVPNKQS